MNPYLSERPYAVDADGNMMHAGDVVQINAAGDHGIFTAAVDGSASAYAVVSSGPGPVAYLPLDCLRKSAE